jgi:hypothetical protein
MNARFDYFERNKFELIFDERNISDSVKEDNRSAI